MEYDIIMVTTKLGLLLAGKTDLLKLFCSYFQNHRKSVTWLSGMHDWKQLIALKAFATCICRWHADDGPVSIAAYDTYYIQCIMLTNNTPNRWSYMECIGIHGPMMESFWPEVAGVIISSGILYSIQVYYGKDYFVLTLHTQCLQFCALLTCIAYCSLHLILYWVSLKSSSVFMNGFMACLSSLDSLNGQR